MSSTTTRRKSNTFYVILIAGATALGGFLFGFDTAVINGAVGALAKAFDAIICTPAICWH
jgi:MFS transporter, SP family, sugar:H+ symporter